MYISPLEMSEFLIKRIGSHETTVSYFILFLRIHKTNIAIGVDNGFVFLEEINTSRRFDFYQRKHIIFLYYPCDSSNVNSSLSVTPSPSAIFLIFTMAMFRLPASTEAKYVRSMPILNANFSWLSPVCCRSSRIRLPKSSVIIETHLHINII